MRQYDYSTSSALTPLSSTVLGTDFGLVDLLVSFYVFKVKPFNINSFRPSQTDHPRTTYGIVKSSPIPEQVYFSEKHQLYPETSNRPFRILTSCHHSSLLQFAVATSNLLFVEIYLGRRRLEHLMCSISCYRPLFADNESMMTPRCFKAFQEQTFLCAVRQPSTPTVVYAVRAAITVYRVSYPRFLNRNKNSPISTQPHPKPPLHNHIPPSHPPITPSATRPPSFPSLHFLPLLSSDPPIHLSSLPILDHLQIHSLIPGPVVSDRISFTFFSIRFATATLFFWLSTTTH